MADTTQPAPAPTTPPDPALGLSEFLEETPAAEGDSPPSPSDPAQPDAGAADPKATTPAADTKPAVPTPDPKKPADDAKKTPEPEKAAAPVPAGAAPATPPKPAEVVALEKQNKDLRDGYSRVNQQLQTQAKQLEILQAKLDGTYDPSMDTPAEPSAEDIQYHAEISGRVKASVGVAERMYGADVVQRELFAEDAPYKAIETAKPWVKLRVMEANTPALEALQILAEERFFDRYGREPEKIRAAIAAEITPELEKTLTTRIKEEFNQRLTKAQDQLPGLSTARGAGGAAAAEAGNGADDEPLSGLVNSELA